MYACYKVKRCGIFLSFEFSFFVPNTFIFQKGKN